MTDAIREALTLGKRYVEGRAKELSETPYYKTPDPLRDDIKLFDRALAELNDIGPAATDKMLQLTCERDQLRRQLLRRKRKSDVVEDLRVVVTESGKQVIQARYAKQDDWTDVPVVLRHHQTDEMTCA
jgi:hypothetical protein